MPDGYSCVERDVDLIDRATISGLSSQHMERTVMGLNRRDMMMAAVSAGIGSLVLGGCSSSPRFNSVQPAPICQRANLIHR